MSVSHVFFDIGGVLGTNGWDHEQRAEVSREFALDVAALDRRHKEVVGAFESGHMSWDEYLDFTVFHEPRRFGRDAFKERVLALSQPFPESLAVVRELGERGLRLFTLNNESEELNLHRIRAFGLRPLFEGFCSSCWLGMRKPQRLIYERALRIAGAMDEQCAVFVDDREQNLAPARALGFRTVHFTDAAALRACLVELDALPPTAG